MDSEFVDIQNAEAVMLAGGFLFPGIPLPKPPIPWNPFKDKIRIPFPWIPRPPRPFPPFPGPIFPRPHC